LHAGATYRVFMVGFVAGLLTWVRCGAHRDAAARNAAGACAAWLGRHHGVQTGVYRKTRRLAVIGRTPLKPFDPDPTNHF
jgi:allophanate hydrolase subunit 1